MNKSQVTVTIHAASATTGEVPSLLAHAVSGGSLPSGEWCGVGLLGLDEPDGRLD